MHINIDMYSEKDVMSVFAIKTADVTQNFKQIADRIFQNSERALISRPRNENLVILTESEINKLDKAWAMLNKAAEPVTFASESEMAKRREMLKSITGIINTDVDVKAMKAERIAKRGLLD